jgi:hypothetical protein
MIELISSNWRVYDSISNLLRGALSGVTSVGAQDVSIDVNSQALFTILVDRLSGGLEARKQRLGASATVPPVERIERPTFRSGWTCPLCSAENANGSEACACGVYDRVARFAQASGGATFTMAERLVIRCVELLSDEGRGVGAAQLATSRRAIARDIKDFLTSSGMAQHERAGWELTRPLTSMFKALLRGDPVIAFDTGSIDVNSRGIFTKNKWL